MLLCAQTQLNIFLYFKKFSIIIKEPAAGLFEGDIFGEGPLQSHSVASVVNKPGDSDEDDDDDDGHFDGGAPSPIPR